ncbi:ABC transporter permease [Synergistales bacterium]|nr:ABC transporter permease [Synergistales bacterium]
MRAFGVAICACIIAFVLIIIARGTDPYAQDLMNTFATPGSEHLLGTDYLGRDIAARTARGTLNSILYAAASVLGSMTLGTFLGMSGAWAGGRTESALLAATDFIMAFPGLLFALFVGGLFKLGAWPIVMSLILTAWAEYCRMSRAMTRVVMARPYVEAGVICGYPPSFLIRKYIFPEIAAQITTLASFGMAKSILYISSLNFVGIGLTPPVPELGAMISESLPYIRRHPFIVVPPSALMSLFVFALILIASETEKHPDKFESERLF